MSPTVEVLPYNRALSDSHRLHWPSTCHVLHMETLLVEYVEPLEVVDTAKVQQERAEEVEDAFCMGVVEKPLGQGDPLVHVDDLLQVEVLDLPHERSFEAFVEYLCAVDASFVDDITR